MPCSHPVGSIELDRLIPHFVPYSDGSTLDQIFHGSASTSREAFPCFPDAWKYDRPLSLSFGRPLAADILQELQI